MLLSKKGRCNGKKRPYLGQQKSKNNAQLSPNLCKLGDIGLTNIINVRERLCPNKELSFNF